MVELPLLLALRCSKEECPTPTAPTLYPVRILATVYSLSKLRWALNALALVFAGFVAQLAHALPLMML